MPGTCGAETKTSATHVPDILVEPELEEGEKSKILALTLRNKTHLPFLIKSMPDPEVKEEDPGRGSYQLTTNQKIDLVFSSHDTKVMEILLAVI